MRRHVSVFMLAGRGSAHWFFLLLLAMAAAETLLLFCNMSILEGEIPFDQLIDSSRVAIPFVIAVLAQMALSVATFSDERGHTTQRLSIGENAVIFWHALYNFCCYLILWGVQLLLLLGFLAVYLGRVAPGYLNHQSVMLAFSRNSFLHTILPLAHTGLYLRNFALFFFLALCTAMILHWTKVNQSRAKGVNGLITIIFYTEILLLPFFAFDNIQSPDGTVFIIVLDAGLLFLLVGFQLARRKMFRAGGEAEE